MDHSAGVKKRRTSKMPFAMPEIPAVQSLLTSGVLCTVDKTTSSLFEETCSEHTKRVVVHALVSAGPSVQELGSQLIKNRDDPAFGSYVAQLNAMIKSQMDHKTIQASAAIRAVTVLTRCINTTTEPSAPSWTKLTTPPDMEESAKVATSFRRMAARPFDYFNKSILDKPEFVDQWAIQRVEAAISPDEPVVFKRMVNTRQLYLIGERVADRVARSNSVPQPPLPLDMSAPIVGTDVSDGTVRNIHARRSQKPKANSLPELSAQPITTIPPPPPVPNPVPFPSEPTAQTPELTCFTVWDEPLPSDPWNNSPTQY